jgi:hypothetical protein
MEDPLKFSPVTEKTTPAADAESIWAPYQPKPVVPRRQPKPVVEAGEQSAGRPESVADSMAIASSAGTIVANQASGKQPRDEMLGATDAQGFTEVSITF